MITLDLESESSKARQSVGFLMPVCLVSTIQLFLLCRRAKST